MNKVSVFGGGAWGRALAFALAEKNEVRIISRRDIGPLLEPLNQSLVALNCAPIMQVSHKEALDAQYFVMAIATSALREWLAVAHLPQEIKILCASKGIESGSGAFVSDIMEERIAHKSIAYLCGPSFASEVVHSLPCALVIHSRNLELSREFGTLMPHFIKTYVSPDVVGGEVAGAYKNVIAIAGGICDGLAFGMNAKASLLARGLVEMSRFGEHFGAKMETFLGLSGAGDLFLTSNSTMSRNYRVGLGLAQGKAINEILKELGEVAEGVITAKAITEIGQRENIYTPIAREINLIINGKNVRESSKALMA
ncbi:NAD(P)H-dependent glycerol-3-phosphate dehydrogenase [Helicobacter sp. MIT 21-1697]|uniref:NAD(P)H-dependent glycerol-3-phosphate dehydrogenase n=1 Tax=Helicobacter sp. MIT 21-1697 TaxID=2993733 RepID=UPI00224A767B|nr:NAD(P)H-dependent glycerol-3-phosphate dehydrogenase [Helicobacter sp. MIT 21-1697]MCX2717009.1 NAD(P)H-dependent glycerol-3-phosphate dehydrogenase [Helicobacter sp. MIT 21-1697]